MTAFLASPFAADSCSLAYAAFALAAALAASAISLASSETVESDDVPPLYSVTATPEGGPTPLEAAGSPLEAIGLAEVSATS